jgi:hypothetical protein
MAACLTRSFDSYRTSANLQETALTPELVRSRGIRLLTEIRLPGDARGTEGQPLVVPNLAMRDGIRHDVLFTATMGNDVQAIDAVTGGMLWSQHIAVPVKSTRAMDMYEIADHWGILSTPVIDLQAGTVYVVAMSSPSGLYRDTFFHLHALDILDGSAQRLPLDLNQAAYHPSLHRASTLGSVPRKQRPGLLFDRRGGVCTVFVATGSFDEAADTNQGWLIACDVGGAQMSIAACWTASVPPYSGAGIWMAGAAPAMDDAGYIYLMTGNGAFDGVENFGESFVKLRYTPRTQVSPANLKLVDWFTPFTDTGRVGGDPTLASISLLPRGGTDTKGGGTSNMDDPNDQDLNSGGPLYLPRSLTGYNKNVLMGAGKDGIVYVMDADKMGRTQLASFAPDRIQKEVYGALLSPPYGLTYDPRPMDIAPVELSTLSTTSGGYTHHLHGSLTAYVSSDHGLLVFAGGENGPVRAFKLNADFTLTYMGCGADIASAGMAPPGGMPGTMMSLSANGTKSGILWCTQPIGDANKAVVPGRLIAYAANWFVNGALVKLWSSEDWGITFAFCKFNPPVCVNGRVFVPTYDARILVFG